jgi:phosphoglycerate dehydrogenase-like enzyme
VTDRPRPSVVVIGASPEDPPPGIEGADRLADVAYAPDLDALRPVSETVEIVFAWRAAADGPMLPAIFGSAANLRWIQAPSDGVDWLLFPALVESDVVVTNARGVFDDAVAEHAITLVLAIAKDLPSMVRAQAERRWRHRDNERLAGRRMLVVGVGPIGRRIGWTASALGMEVRGVGRSRRSADPDLGEIVGIETLHEALGRADVVIDVLPGTERTRHVFDASTFRAMLPSAWFVNVGRGSTVDEAAFVEALSSGRIAGAALDVFEHEPLPPESPLWDLPNVFISPHVAGDYSGWHEAVGRRFVENLARYVRGEPLVGVVDKRLGFPTGDP